VARLYSNENFPLPVVEGLRTLGHDVLTSLEAGNANISIPDDQVLQFAYTEQRALLTNNRKHFIHLHKSATPHAGIIVCTYDPDFARQATRISAAIIEASTLNGTLLRVNRPNA
jgi:Domain of unknown function (DUF5615)